MWHKSENSDSVKPAAIDTSSANRVLIRKDFVLVPASMEEGHERPEHWEYSECSMSPKEFDIYMEQQSKIDYIAMMTDIDIDDIA